MFKLFGLLIFALTFYYVYGECESTGMVKTTILKFLSKIEFIKRFTILLEQCVPEEDQQRIVDKHNELRNQILRGTVPGQPKGKKLKTIVSINIGIINKTLMLLIFRNGMKS